MSSTKAWVRLPLALLEQHGVLPTDAVMLSVIIDRCIDRPDHAAALDRAKLAAAAGCSIRQVAYTCQRLEQLGLIERQRTGRATIYQLTGAVELLPPKRTADRPAQRAGRPADELAEYAAMLNRGFKEEVAL